MTAKRQAFNTIADALISVLGLNRPLRVDVDGNEDKIIRGGRRTFSNPVMKSLLIELNENDRALLELIESCGLVLECKTLAALQGSHRDTFNAVFRRGT